MFWYIVGKINIRRDFVNDFAHAPTAVLERTAVSVVIEVYPDSLGDFHTESRGNHFLDWLLYYGLNNYSSSPNYRNLPNGDRLPRDRAHIIEQTLWMRTDRFIILRPEANLGQVLPALRMASEVCWCDDRKFR